MDKMPKFQRTVTEREEVRGGVHIRNESNKLPGHEARLKAQERRIQREYFSNNPIKTGCAVLEEKRKKVKKKAGL